MILPISMTAMLPLAALCASVLSAVSSYILLCSLRAQGIRQAIREDGPESHFAKGKTPSMGGIAIVFALVVVAMACAAGAGVLGHRLLIVLGLTLAFAVIGFVDDYSKVTSGQSRGLPARYRITLELLLAVAAVVLLSMLGNDAESAWHETLLWLWAPLGVFVIVGGANAVNLTDGLDGLAGGLVAICGAAMAIVLLLVGDSAMALAAAVTAGAAGGFLWLNAHPAKIFMGDVGSLALGACLSAIAVAAQIELLFALFAAVFVFETISVILQVAYFKLTGGKRIFRMSPFHHHLELCEWPEPTVVLRLWLIGAACGLLGILVAVQFLLMPG
jgi:phospho-N-acetylmuramoyl-pentapeptide-transferase